MAAWILRCDGCGRTFIGKRRHRRWHSEACGRATRRAFTAAGKVPEVPEYEPRVLGEIAAGRISPEHGILWMVDPEGMRRRYQHKAVGA
jgi:hypothetical protein